MAIDNSNSFLTVGSPQVESPTVESPFVKSPTVESPFTASFEPTPFRSLFDPEEETGEDWFESRRRKRREEKLRADAEKAFGEESSKLSPDELADTLKKTSEIGEKLDAALTQASTETIKFPDISLSAVATPLLIEGVKNVFPSVLETFDVVGFTDEAGAFVVQATPIKPPAPDPVDVSAPIEQTISGPEVTGATSDVGVSAAEKAGQVADIALKTASVVTAIAAIDEFLENPNIGTGLTAATSTALSAAAFGSPTGKAIAQTLGPIGWFYAGTQIFQALTYDADYRRSQGVISYEDGQFISKDVQGADRGKHQWAEAQTKVATETLNSLVEDYGFEVDVTKLGGQFAKKSTIMNNPQYGQNMGGRDVSLSGAELIITALREGALKPTDATPDDISKTSEDFAKFIGDTVNKMNDQYAKHIWDNYEGVADQYSTGLKAARKTTTITAAFGTEDGAKDYVKSKVDDIEGTSSKRVEYVRVGKARKKPKDVYSRTEYVYDGEKDYEVARGAVYQGGHSISAKTYDYTLQDGSYSKADAVNKIKELNASSEPYDYTYQVRRGKGYRSATGQKKKIYQALYIDGQYRIGEREEII